jgi:DNA-binding transcriptional ArsR family regulator
MADLSRHTDRFRPNADMVWSSSKGRRSAVPSHFQIALDIILYFAKLRNMNLVFKALSDPTRRQILHLLRKKPMTAGDLAEHFSLAKPTLSGHFAVLREADLIEASKSGTVITYMLKVSVLEEALLAFAETVGIGLPTPTPLKKATGKAK